MNRRLTRTGNRIAVWLYRRLDGRLSSGRKDVHVLLITTPGRRTGVPRSTCVRFLETADGPVVWGTGSGSPRDPDWFKNLRAADDRRGADRPRSVPGQSSIPSTGSATDRTARCPPRHHAPTPFGRPLPGRVLGRVRRARHRRVPSRQPGWRLLAASGTPRA